MSVINAIPLFLGDEGYQISRSVRLRSSASAYLDRTFTTPTSRRIFTLSAWTKRGVLGATAAILGNAGTREVIGFFGNTSGNGDALHFRDTTNGSYEVTTTAVFRDPSAWYHIVVAFDTTQATASNRVKMYVNGVQQTSFAVASYPAQNTDLNLNSAVVHAIGRRGDSSAYNLDGYLTEVNFIDGLTPNTTTRTVGGVTQTVLTELGEFDAVTGVWKPVRWTRSFGTNGFYLNFSDNTSPTNVITGNSGIGRDFSGNGNYWISNNVSLYGGTTQSFTSTGTTSWTAPAGVTSVQYLIVGGGGGGTNYSGGGGGAVVTGTMSVTPGSSYSVTVGAGGSGGVTPTDGADSAFAGVTATKGLKAASAYVGGASGSGFAGGTGANLANPYLGGGGGGAGGAGNNRSGTTAGAGGVGVSVTIGSTTSTYGGGGGGGAEGAGSRGVGGSGGGGNGSGPLGSPAGSAGTANTGGGGGGGDGGNTTSGFAGGSGTVILAYGSSATYDSMLDVPTQWADGGNGRGNYATLNPLQTGSYVTQSNGNLTNTGNTATNSALVLASIGQLTSGKWYWEYTQGSVMSETCGICTQDMSGVSLINGENIGAYGVGVRAAGTVYGGTVGSITSWTTGDVIGIAVDCDNGAAYWSKNGTWLNSGVPTSGSSKTGAVGTWTPGPTKLITPAFGAYNGGSISATFGQRPFAYTPPTGFKALNTLNLPTPTILKGNQYFDATTYTGTGASLNVVNSGGMQPDFVWTKPRSTAVGHTLFDSVRGVTKYLQSNTTGAEGTAATSLTAFNSNGFTVNSDTSTGANGVTYVGWQWKEGATQGFDIVTYTESAGVNTIPHSLGVTPKMFITKRRDGVENWVVWFTGFANTEAMYLNSTAAKSASGSAWISLNSSNVQVTSGQWTGTGNKVAYLFSEVAGFSRFGSYTGNGSTDGPFVFCGFRPAFVLVKASSNSTASTFWAIWDTRRNPSNASVLELYPNSSSAELTDASGIDILSNGFKPRRNSEYANFSGWTYIFAAFAENPFKNALAR